MRIAALVGKRVFLLVREKRIPLKEAVRDLLRVVPFDQIDGKTDGLAIGVIGLSRNVLGRFEDGGKIGSGDLVRLRNLIEKKIIWNLLQKDSS